jgi:hypothetical protein
MAVPMTAIPLYPRPSSGQGSLVGYGRVCRSALACRADACIYIPNPGRNRHGMRAWQGLVVCRHFSQTRVAIPPPAVPPRGPLALHACYPTGQSAEKKQILRRCPPAPILTHGRLQRASFCSLHSLPTCSSRPKATSPCPCQTNMAILGRLALSHTTVQLWRTIEEHVHTQSLLRGRRHCCLSSCSDARTELNKSLQGTALPNPASRM